MTAVDTHDQLKLAALTLTIDRWRDPVIEAVGQPVTSRYVEVFWLPILGPSAVWLLRHVSYHTEQGPYVVEAEVLGKCLGLAGVGRNSPVRRSLHRLVQFRCGHGNGLDRWALPTHLPMLTPHHVDRLPDALREAHRHITDAVTP